MHVSANEEGRVMVLMAMDKEGYKMWCTDVLLYLKCTYQVLMTLPQGPLCAPFVCVFVCVCVCDTLTASHKTSPLMNIM